MTIARRIRIVASFFALGSALFWAVLAQILVWLTTAGFSTWITGGVLVVVGLLYSQVCWWVYRWLGNSIQTALTPSRGK